MNPSIVRVLDPDRCESVLADINDFVGAEYTEANIRDRRGQVYEYGLDLEAFAFAIHCPGSSESDHLPGFRLDEIPGALASLTEMAVERLGLSHGRVLWNLSRYAPHCQPLPPHFDGELFEFEPHPVEGNTVHSGIRPREVALLTLRNESRACQTTLHDADGKVTYEEFVPLCFQLLVEMVSDSLVPMNFDYPTKILSGFVGYRTTLVDILVARRQKLK